MRHRLKEAVPNQDPALTEGISDDTWSELITQVAFPGLHGRIIDMIDELREELSRKLRLVCMEKQNRLIAQQT